MGVTSTITADTYVSGDGVVTVDTICDEDVGIGKSTAREDVWPEIVGFFVASTERLSLVSCKEAREMVFGKEMSTPMLDDGFSFFPLAPGL